MTGRIRATVPVVATLWRFEDDGTGTLAGRWGELHVRATVGTRFPMHGENLASQVFRTGRTARMDDYTDATCEVGEAFRAMGVRAGNGVPIVVEGRLWGAMGAAATDPLPPDGGTLVTAAIPVPSGDG